MKYESMEEALKDVEYVRKHPNDKVALVSIRTKVLNSSEQLQKDIKDYLEAFLFDNEPDRLMKLMSEKHIGRVVTKKGGLFFEA
jgi:hypothetical protein